LQATPSFASPPSEMKAIAAASLACAVVFGCSEPPPPATCEDGPVEAPATLPDRAVLGIAKPYEPDPSLSGRGLELLHSVRARRQVGWDIAARVLESVDIGSGRVPRFRTWHDEADVRRAFERAFSRIGSDRRAARDPLMAGEIEEAFRYDADAVHDDPAWSDQRYAEYLASLDTDLELQGVSGIRRITTSPDLSAHVLASYPQLDACARGSRTLPVEETSTQTLLETRVELGACEERDFGPFILAEGERLLVDAEGALIQLDGVPCSASCEAHGFGAHSLRARAQADGAVSVRVRKQTPTTPPACLAGPFPLASASVALEWRRMDEGAQVPAYDTDASTLRTLLAGEATWGEGRPVTPSQGDLYVVQTRDGTRFALVAMHVRTRELERWASVTLWYSPDPDSDFGSDRSPAFLRLGAPFSSFKMCIAIEDRELVDPRLEIPEGTSLGDALAAVYEGASGSSWCSNPYIDAAPGLVRSNCVGCHQHAMSGVRPGETVLDETSFPDHGRRIVRRDFPGDSFWGLDQGDRLSTTVQSVVDYWLAP
jgi:hypothetical protein